MAHLISYSMLSASSTNVDLAVLPPMQNRVWNTGVDSYELGVAREEEGDILLDTWPKQRS